MDRLISAFAGHFPLIHRLFTTQLKLTLAGFAVLFALIATATYGGVISESEDLFTKAGPIIGGDFIVFNFAAQVAGGPDMAAIYEMANLKAMLETAYPGRGELNFAWMYPPTMSLLIEPFGKGPYVVSLILWIVTFGGLYAATVRQLWADKWALLFTATAPATFQAIITGQNGFLTASLLAIAGAFADRRPIVAGIAAGLLTVKPQLGILIPIAFLAAGCWRAFFAAGVTAILLAFASLLAYGPETWVGFYESVTAHSARMSGAGFPYYKLVTPYGFATVIGAPSAIASMVQLAASVMLAAYVFFVWRRVKDWGLRVAALSTAAMLATPYAFYYEFVIMAPAMLLIARRAVETGWLPYERISLVAVWAAPLMMPGLREAPLPLCSACAILAFLVAARRTLAAAGVRFAIEAQPAPAGY